MPIRAFRAPSLAPEAEDQTSGSAGSQLQVEDALSGGWYGIRKKLLPKAHARSSSAAGRHPLVGVMAAMRLNSDSGEGVMKTSGEWPRPLLYQIAPVFWYLTPHRIHLLCDFLVVAYFMCVAVRPPEWILECMHALGMPDSAAQMVAVWVALRFCIILLQMESSRWFAMNEATREMLATLRENDHDFIRNFEKAIAEVTVFSILGHASVMGVSCIMLLEWSLAWRVFAYGLLPLTYHHWQVRFSAIAFKLAIIFSKGKVEDLCLKLRRGSGKTSRSLSLWDSLKGEMPKEVSVLHKPKDDGKHFSQQAEHGYWTQLIREHQQLSRDLVQVWIRAELPFVLFMCQLLLFVCGVFMMALLSRNFLFKAVCSFLGGSVLLSSFVFDLLPAAEVTNTCIGNDVGTRSIRTLANRHFGREDMDTQVVQEHENFVQYIDASPMGIYLPFLGRMEVAWIASNVRIVASVLPLVLGHFAVEHQQNRG